jgi:hypothetical protein
MLEDIFSQGVRVTGCSGRYYHPGGSFSSKLRLAGMDRICELRYINFQVTPHVIPAKCHTQFIHPLSHPSTSLIHKYHVMSEERRGEDSVSCCAKHATRKSHVFRAKPPWQLSYSTTTEVGVCGYERGALGRCA